MSLLRVARDVWRVGKGRPRVAIFGGVHGNELTGVKVVNDLVHRFSNAMPTNVLCGELTLAIGNPDAVKRNVRYIDDDLNRCFQDSSGVVDTASTERSRAKELVCFLQDLDVLVDLHATNKPSEPFIRLPGPLDEAYFSRCEALFAAFLPGTCNTILWDPRGLIGGGRMSDEFAMQKSEHEGCFICLESGIASDVDAVPAVAAAVDAMLVRLGIVETDAPPQYLHREWAHYEIFDVFRLDDHGFQWVNGHGNANFDPVPAGEAFAQRGSEGSFITAMEDAYIVFPKVRSLWALGRPVGWLARKISFLSS